MDATARPRHELIDRANTALEGAAQLAADLKTTVSRCAHTLVVLRSGDDNRGGEDRAPAAVPWIDEMRLSVRDESGAQHVLTPTEWRLLRLLAEAHGRVRTRSELAQQLWGFDNGRDSEVEVYISRLRRKLGGERQSLITTVRGQGYRLERPL